MPYVTLVAATTITSAWANASVRDQVVTPFADAAARASAVTAPVAGMVSVLTSTKRVDVYNGSDWSALVAPAWGEWTTYTPTFTQSATIAKTVGQGKWMRVGRRISGVFFMTASSAGTASNVIAAGLPVALISSAANNMPAGTGYFSDVSAAGNYICSLGVRDSTSVNFITTGGLLGTGVAITVASGDIVGGEFGYEANTDA